MLRPMPSWLGFDHVFGRLIDRLDGLTDAEYAWRPAPRTWGIEPTAAGGHRAFRQIPAPDPPPLTTIGWRMCHIGDTLRESRNWRWLGRQPPFPEDDVDHPVTADSGVRYLRDSYSVWVDLVRSVDDVELFQPLGPVAGAFGNEPKVALFVHILDEVVHHGAEVALLRDLYGDLRRSGGDDSPLR